MLFWDREHADCTGGHSVIPAHPLLTTYVITLQYKNTLVGIHSPCIISCLKRDHGGFADPVHGTLPSTKY